MSLPNPIIQVLLHFRPAFTCPTWDKALVLVVGTILARGRRTVTAALKQMGLHVENRLWGAERIRGELLKLDLRVCKRTIQKYMRQARKPGPGEGKSNQNWCTFARNHAPRVWAVDFLPVYDLFFRPLFVLFIIELGSRRVVHFG